MTTASVCVRIKNNISDALFTWTFDAWVDCSFLS